MRDVLNVTRTPVHRFADLVFNDRNRDFLQFAGQRTVLVESSPARHESSASNKVLVRVWYANRDNVRLEHDWLIEPKEEILVIQRSY